MLYEPEIVIAQAKRAGLTLKRTGRGTIMVLGKMDKVPDEWVDFIRLHKAVLLPHLPPYIKAQQAEPQKATLAQPAPYGLRFLPERGNYDMFDGVTPLCLKHLPTKRKASHKAAFVCPVCRMEAG